MWIWIKKYWWIVAGAVASVLMSAAKLLPGKRDNARIAREAREAVDRVKVSAKIELDKHNQMIEQRWKELDDIMDFDDEMKRLNALAELTDKGERP